MACIVVHMYLGEKCYINVDTGNSSYRDPSALAADVAAVGGCHGNAICSITLTNPVRYYNDHILLNTESAMSHDDHDDDDNDDGMCLL